MQRYAVCVQCVCSVMQCVCSVYAVCMQCVCSVMQYYSSKSHSHNFGATIIRKAVGVAKVTLGERNEAFTGAFLVFMSGCCWLACVLCVFACMLCCFEQEMCFRRVCTLPLKMLQQRKEPTQPAKVRFI